MITTHFKRIFNAGIKNFTRNTFVSLASVLTMVVMLFVIAGTFFVNSLLVDTLATLQEKVDINVYFTPTTEESPILALQKDLQRLPEVKEVTYISRDEALALFTERHKNNQATLNALQELGGDNPLGATLTIKAKETSQYESISEFLNTYTSNPATTDYVDKVNYFDNKKAIDTLDQLITGAKVVGVFISVLFIALALFITLNTLRLAIYISKDEIHVMNMVGASRNYISGPFMVTGALYGLVAALAVMIILWPVTFWMTSKAQEFFADINFFGYYVDDFFKIFFGLVFIGVVTGALASIFAVKKYVKNHRK